MGSELLFCPSALSETRAAEVGDGAARRAGPAPSLSNSHNCNDDYTCSQPVSDGGQWSKLTGSHRRVAFMVTQEIQILGAKFGVNHLGFLTLTFSDPVNRIGEAQKRFHSLQTAVLKPRYSRGMAVLERQKSGRVHFHLVVTLAADIRSGIDFKAIAQGDYRSANSALRSEWAFWRRTAPLYGFGRTELLPVKSTAEGIAKYVGKYVSKHVGSRLKSDVGARLVRFFGYGPGERRASSQFGWASVGGALWRRKCKVYAARVGVKTSDDLCRLFGPRWCYLLTPTIMAQDITSYGSLAELKMDEVNRGAAFVLEARAQKILDGMKFTKTYQLKKS